MRQLMQHQVQACQYLRQQQGRGALFMQMRLGKTLCCIRELKGKILVVAPVEGLWAWQRELKAEGKPFTLLVGTRKQRIQALSEGPAHGWFLINYEGYRTIEYEIQRYRWHAVVADESRKMANPKSKVSKALNALPRLPNQARVVLCGEPAPEGPLEYFQQMKFVYGRFMGTDNYWQFRNYYFQELGPHDWVIKPRYLEQLKDELHSRAFFMSRKEAGLPDKKMYEVRALKFPPEIRKAYEKIKEDFVATLAGIETTQTKWVPVQYIWLHQLATGFFGEKMVWDGKVKQLGELLKGELCNEQVVVWFRFNSGIREVSSLLAKLRIPFRTITGEAPRVQRESAIDAYRLGEYRVLLCQIKCGKTAIDLSNSSTAIYFSNSYSLEDRHQTEDRILNPKKSGPLLYVDLLTEATVEEDILDVLRSKSGESKFFMSKLLQRLKS